MNTSKKTIDLFRLDGRVALVTGASGRLGRKMAQALCDAGCHVILNGRTLKTLENFALKLANEGYNVSIVPFDVSEPKQTKSAFLHGIEKHERLDIIVNNAYAYATRRGNLNKTDLQDFDHSFKVSVTATYNLIQIARPLLEKTALKNMGGASVINVSSMYGMVSSDPRIYGNSGFDDPAYYGPAKAALIQLTRYSACRLAPFNIRVNSISPGPFPPQEIGAKNPLLYEKLCEKTPMQRIGYTDEIKGPLIFLASDASSYVTGINLPIDGGWTAW